MAGKSPDYTVPDLAKEHFCLYLNVGILLLSALHISKSLCKLFSPVKELILSFSQVIQSSKRLNSYKEANGKRYFKISNYFVFLFLKV